MVLCLIAQYGRQVSKQYDPDQTAPLDQSDQGS